MLVAAFAQYFFGFTIFITSMFLIMLVLVQRGRGGGLTGALGGPGGQSAFGTKAGDLFTRITIGVAAVWIFLCAAAVFFLKDRGLPQTGVSGRNLPALMGDADVNVDNFGIETDGGLNLPPLDLPLGDGAEDTSFQPTTAPDAEVPSPDSPAAEVTDPAQLDPAPADAATPEN